MKKLYTVLLSATLLLSVQSNAQNAPSIQWQKSLGGSGEDDAKCIHQTSDGGYIIAGQSNSNSGDVSGNHGGGALDCWIVKTDSIGTIQWQKCFGGTGDDGAASIVQTKDGGYIVVGFTSSNDGDVSGNHSPFFGYDEWVAKLTSEGIIQWQKCLGGSGDEFAYSVVQTFDGGYTVIGQTDSNDGDVSGNHDTINNDLSASDEWVVKLDPTGAIEWQKCLGGTGDDVGFSIKQTKDSGFITSGYSTSVDGDAAGNNGVTGAWIVKLNKDSSIQWQENLNNNWAKDVQQTFDGGYIVFADDGDYLLFKLDSGGKVQWQKSYGGSNDESSSSIKQTSDSGYVVAGWSNSTNGDVTGNHGDFDYWITKVDNSGNLQWQRSLGGSNADGQDRDGIDVYIQETNDNGYIVSGSSSSNDGDVSGNHGFTDYWIVKLNPDAILPVSLINLSGEVNGKQNLLHWTTATEQNNTGFEVQSSSDGYNFSKIGFVNSKAINGNSSLKLNYDFADIGFGADKNYYRLKQVDKDGKFTYSNIVVLRDDAISNQINVYPNPVKDLINVKINSANNTKIILNITDNSGKIILTKLTYVSTGETIIQLNISQLAAGSYFIKILSADGSEKAQKKFIKQ